MRPAFSKVITIWWTEQTIEQGGGAFGGYRLLKAGPGRARSTLELLADEMVRLTDHDELPSETVRRRLAENHLKPWRKDM